MSKVSVRRSKNQAGEFGERLRLLRLQKGLQQQDLAAKCGVTKAHFGRYERGLSMPNADALKQISIVLGVSSDYLLGADAAQQPSPAATRLGDPELLVQFQEIERLPERDRSAIKEVMAAFLLGKKIQALTS